jgi:hypothetical protein
MTKIETNVGEDSREEYQLIDDTPEIKLQDLQQKIKKLDSYIEKTNTRIENYEQKLHELLDIDDELKIKMKKEVYGAQNNSTLQIQV